MWDIRYITGRNVILTVMPHGNFLQHKCLSQSLWNFGLKLLCLSIWYSSWDFRSRIVPQNAIIVTLYKTINPNIPNYQLERKPAVWCMDKALDFYPEGPRFDSQQWQRVFWVLFCGFLSPSRQMPWLLHYKSHPVHRSSITRLYIIWILTVSFNKQWTSRKQN
jgi:hypothetical protein